MPETAIGISGEVPAIAWCRDGRLFSNVAGPYAVYRVSGGARELVAEGDGPVDEDFPTGAGTFEVETG